MWAWLSELDLLAANATREDRLALLGQGQILPGSAWVSLLEFFLEVGEAKAAESKGHKHAFIVTMGPPNKKLVTTACCQCMIRLTPQCILESSCITEKLEGRTSRRVSEADKAIVEEGL